MSAARRRPWARRAALIVPVVLLATAGCGTKRGGDGDGVASVVRPGAGRTTTTTTPVDDETARINFTNCLREHGIDVEDAKPGGNSKAGGKHKVEMKVTGKDPKKMQAAMKACQKFAPNGGQPPKLDPQQVAAMRKMAACMRDHGVTSFPDPDSSGMLKLDFQQGKSDPAMDPENPAFKKAMEACRSDDMPLMQSRSDGGPGMAPGPGGGESGGGAQLDSSGSGS